MLIAFTIYFWFFTALQIVWWVQSLTKQPKITEMAKDAKTDGERLAYQGCVALIATPIVLLIATPSTYLQAIGLESLGLPGWIAWAVFAVSWVGAFAQMFKRQTVSGYITTPAIYAVLLAWYGLTVLQAAAK